MPVIICQERRIDSRGDDVLQSLERAGIGIPSGCRTGRCQNCLAQLKGGSPPPLAQRGLNSRQRDLNYFLACQYQPESDIEIELLDLNCRRTAILVEKQELNARVLRVRLRAEVDWRAGQYLTLWRTPLKGRPYSIASRPEEGFMELHVRRRGGLVSGWLEHELDTGDECLVSLPRGDCFYSPAMPGQSMVLVGMGTGLSPVYGVLKQALVDGHHGDICVYACAGEPGHFYLLRELQALSAQSERLRVVPVVRRDADRLADAQQEDVAALLASRHPNLRGQLVYLSGEPAQVARLHYQCFMQGAHPGNIFSDPFEWAN